MKPPFAYYGGKTTLADRIVAQLPSHEHYVEPFAGSLAVLLAKAPSRMETVNDIDQDLMTFWRILRERPDELIRACSLTPHSRAEYALSHDRTGDLTELERARRVWSCLAQGRSGNLKRTGWRFSINESGRSGGVTGDLAGYVRRMESVAERLSHVSLECRPALELIETYGACETVLLYVDPPYLLSTRAGTNYQHEMPSEDEHRGLAEALNACRATVVLSGYASKLYADLYDGWHITRINTTTGQGGTRQDRTEVLWCNRPPADTLFGEEIA